MKINYITNAFTSIRKHSGSLRFCHNTWELFIRPLLDYSSTYINFCPEKSQEKLRTLYRTSLRKMLFLKDYTPVELIDMMIGYDYQNLPRKALQLANIKFNERRRPDPDNDNLFLKINFNYNKLDYSTVPFNLSNALNALYNRGQCGVCKDGKKYGPRHWIEHLRNLGYIDNPVDVCYSVLCNDHMSILDKERIIDTLYKKLQLLAIKT